MIDSSCQDRPDLTAWVTEQFGILLKTIESPVGLEIGDLVGLAIRRNPRRAHLLVSTVLGKHVPVDPNVVVGMGRLLGELVAGVLQSHGRQDDWAAHTSGAVHHADPGPLLAALESALDQRPTCDILVLGFAETATSLGHLVADQLHADCYLHSTRRRVPDVEVAARFEEGHSHATSHLLLPIPGSLLHSRRPMVLVDDELSTGRTAMNTIMEAHQRQPRDRYVLASLVDLRSSGDKALLLSLARRLGCRIDVVSLVRGEVQLPPGLSEAVSARLAAIGGAAADAHSPVSPAFPDRVLINWPAGVPDGGRHGFTTADRPAFEMALSHAVQTLAEVVGRRLAESGSGNQVLVVGTEELMYVPLRLAQMLSHRDLVVGFQSTTRSPVLCIDHAGYPIRRQFSFVDAEGDRSAPRFLYNAHGRLMPAVQFAEVTDPALVVVVVDSAADTADLHCAAGPLAALAANGLRVLLAVLGELEPRQLALARTSAGVPVREPVPVPVPDPLPEPLVGPGFGSYRAAEVRWLLTDLSDLDLEADVVEREAAIQAGTAHYAESLPVEFTPDGSYQELFKKVLAGSTQRLALAVGRVTELVLAERGHDVVFASLARAGTPIGILMRRWAEFNHGLRIPHYAVSIVRGRGIDSVALRYLAAHHEARRVVFVDGWTGKGAIAKELTAALAEVNLKYALDFSDDLAVLADPGHCVRTFGTRDDFLIASACLNSTVSGLVSRTVLNDAFLLPGQFHGAKYYRELAAADVSALLLDSVAAAFPAVLDSVGSGARELADSDREPTFAGWAAIERIRAEYGIESVNFVKPGVGETTRVLLRRVPWRILVRAAGSPDHEHLRLLAQQRGVPVEVRPDLPYSCVGLIRRMSTSEPGEA